MLIHYTQIRQTVHIDIWNMCANLYLTIKLNTNTAKRSIFWDSLGRAPWRNVRHFEKTKKKKTIKPIFWDSWPTPLPPRPLDFLFGFSRVFFVFSMFFLVFSRFFCFTFSHPQDLLISLVFVFFFSRDFCFCSVFFSFSSDLDLDIVSQKYSFFSFSSFSKQTTYFLMLLLI